ATLGVESIARLSTSTDLLIRGTDSIHLYSGLVLGGRDGAGAATLGNLTLDSPLLQAEGAPGGTSQITAGHLTLRNSGGTASGAAGTGSLVLDSDTLTLGPGKVTIAGDSRLQLETTELELRGVGGLTFGGDVTIQAARVQAASGTSYALSAGGALDL